MKPRDLSSAISSRGVYFAKSGLEYTFVSFLSNRFAFDSLLATLWHSLQKDCNPSFLLSHLKNSVSGKILPHFEHLFVSISDIAYLRRQKNEYN